MDQNNYNPIGTVETLGNEHLHTEHILLEPSPDPKHGRGDLDLIFIDDMEKHSKSKVVPFPDPSTNKKSLAATTADYKSTVKNSIGSRRAS
jgi:hypothetical protein